MKHVLIFGCILTALGAATGPGTLGTAVGTAEKGYDGDGRPATQAHLNNPFDVAFDAGGNLFLSDTFNHCVRRVDARSHVITTVAGDGRAGDSGDGGPAVKARLNEPYGIVLDHEGNLFVADRLNRRVRRVDVKSGIITTVAGDGSKKYSGDGRPARRAGIAEPNGVALDSQGKRLFIADVADHRVRVVDLTSGMITTFAGDGRGRHAGDGSPARSASIFGARAVAVGADNTVYILERSGNALRAVDPTTGKISTVAGTRAKGYTGDGGPALAATFNGPKELAIDPAGNLFIVDTENHAIRRIDAGTKLITTVAGDGTRGSRGDGGPATSGQLARPHGVAVDSHGAIFIGDTENHRIRTVLP
jgi:DNA-binding beta-propeller fold protein YncE